MSTYCDEYQHDCISCKYMYSHYGEICNKDKHCDNCNNNGDTKCNCLKEVPEYETYEHCPYYCDDNTEKTEIEKLAAIIGNGCKTPCKRCNFRGSCDSYRAAQRVLDAGYRRQDEQDD